jgi:hypothetical protein
MSCLETEYWRYYWRRLKKKLLNCRQSSIKEGGKKNKSTELVGSVRVEMGGGDVGDVRQKRRNGGSLGEY